MGPILSKQPLVSSDAWEKAQTDVGSFSQQLLQVAKLIQISKREQFVEVISTVTDRKLSKANLKFNLTI